MVVTDRFDNPMFEQGTSVALGFFDGVHRGHRAVISEAVSQAGTKLMPVVLTFSTSPHQAGIPLLMTREDKCRTLEGLGVQGMVTLAFSSVKDMSPAQFVEQVLDSGLHAKKVVCGFNYRFGRDAAGDISLLKSLCAARGIAVSAKEPVIEEGQPISSTRIRRALEEGYVDTAARLLGRPFSFSFPVVDGDHRGRLLGAPTINQPFPAGFIRPRFGVYAASAMVEGQERVAVCNIGMRPTVGAEYLRAETFILDFQGDLYGRNITVSLYKFLRPEVKFPTLDDLRRAIHNDAQVTDAYMKQMQTSAPSPQQKEGSRKDEG